MDKNEKRLTQRKRAEYVVEFYNPDGLLTGIGRLMDLSATGALVESSLRLAPGQVLQVLLRRGDRSKLNLSVTVVRVRGKGTTMTYGLKFNRDQPLSKLF